MRSVKTNWPRFYSTQHMRAIEIAEIQPNKQGALIVPTDSAYEPLQVDHDFLGRHVPEIGGVLMQFDSGYVSYSPGAAFYAYHVPVDGCQTFGAALGALKHGWKVRRRGWNGKGLWLELQEPDEFSKMTLPYIFINYPDDAQNTPGARVPWLASQTDMLANDWEVIDEVR